MERFDDHLTDEETAVRLTTLPGLKANQKAADQLERIERLMTPPQLICADPLGVSGAEAVTQNDPSLGNMLIPFFVLFAFAAGAFLAYLT